MKQSGGAFLSLIRICTYPDRRINVGSTAALNAASLFLIIGSGLLALISVAVQRDKPH